MITDNYSRVWCTDNYVSLWEANNTGGNLISIDYSLDIDNRLLLIECVLRLIDKPYEDGLIKDLIKIYDNEFYLNNPQIDKISSYTNCITLYKWSDLIDGVKAYALMMVFGKIIGIC